MTQRPGIAIIGAGISGLQLALKLRSFCDVRLFEKSRGLGGRMSTRRADAFQFDHGAQYFTAHGTAFQDFLRPFVQAGTVALWQPRLAGFGGDTSRPPVWTAPRYVAVPGMNALCKAMAEGLDVRRATRVAQIERKGATWQLTAETGEDCGHFDWVVTTAPAEQSMKLLPDLFARTCGTEKAAMQGCYSLMLGFEEAVNLPWDAATVSSGPLAWIARNDSKPGRSRAMSILCQTDNDWADQHVEDDQDAVQETLCAAFEAVTGLDPADATYQSLHRWRFAKVKRTPDSPYLLDAEHQLAAAGDWCGAGRVEAGFDSATGLADTLIAQWHK